MVNKKPKVAKDNAERWLLTYSDLMNLLLILFIILYTMSKVDTAKYQQVAQSLRSTFGMNSAANFIGEGGGSNSMINLGESKPEPAGTPDGSGGTAEERQMKDLEQKISEVIKKEGLEGSIEVSMQERGIVITIKEKVLFKSGSAEIDKGSEPTIENIGKVLLAIPGKQIRVEGHTDTDPIKNSRYPDNQELSTARANSVWRLLVNKAGIHPEILSATGYGEFRPRVPNNSEENKALNRRVDIVILKDEYNKSEAGTN